MKENGKKIVIVQKKAESKQQDQPDEIKETSDSEDIKTFDKEAMNNMDQATFEELYEKSFAEFGQGEIITGKIASIQMDKVFVDVGYKSEGTISISEFEEDIEVGDDVKVMVVRMEDEDGNVVLSKKKADMVIAKDVIEKHSQENLPVQGKILKEVKGGFVVDVGGGMEAFLPGSQVALKKVTNANELIGKKFDFKVAKYEPGKNNIILSRRIFLEEKLEQEREVFFSNIKDDDVVQGKVKNVLDYGAFIELGPVDGFIHLKDVSWGHIKNCHTILHEGDENEFKVLKVDFDQKKVTLGLKQLTDDPWELFVKEQKKEDVVHGEVMKFADFGAFVKVTDGVEGLLHVNDMSWTKKISHPKQVLKIGEHIEASILDIDKENRKLSLGLKQILPNPWDTIAETYPKGKKLNGKVKSITNFGVFIELDEGLTGLLHKNDVDWIKKIPDLRKEKKFKKGQTIEVVVLQTNRAEETISLGLKQLLDNPWEIFKANHPKGSVIKGIISKIADIGAFVKIDDNIDGFLHISEMAKKRSETIEERYKEGDEVNCVVNKIDVKKNQISLSTKDYEKRMEQMAIDKYTKESTTDDKVTLGDFIDFNQFQDK